jgi:sec-independent protein translocase protein TatB
MLNLDPAKLLIIAVVAIILLGPDKLPQVARQVGGAWRSFNEFRHRMETEVRSSIPDLPASHEIARLARSPSALLEHLSNMGSDSKDGTAATAGAAVDGTAGDAATNPPSMAPPGTNANGNGSTPAATPPAQSPVVVPGDPTLN